MQIRTNGGSSDTEERELTVIPCSSSCATVVTTVTPVANAPIVDRNAATSTSRRPSRDIGDPQ